VTIKTEDDRGTLWKRTSEEEMEKLKITWREMKRKAQDHVL